MIRVAALALMLMAGACGTAAVSPRPSTSVSASTTMPRLTSASIAYDPGSKLILLFGMTEGDSKPTTWTWDGRSWTQQRPRSSPALPNGSLAYDWVTSSIIFFGGTYPGRESETWAWKDLTWVLLHPPAEPIEPASAYTFTLASDARSRRVLAFGGCCAQSTLPSTTWAWDGVTWSRLQPTTAPSNRVGVNMAWDEATGQLVLFDLVSVVAPQTWIWTGSNWERRA